jgi:isopentenyl diphosphate isomerase/L-lactate dehydrogenase-like FMN-dependent dehydrogenase
VLWGLAHSGEEGVYNVLKLINDELILAMKLAGCVSLNVRTISYFLLSFF